MKLISIYDFYLCFSILCTSVQIERKRDLGLPSEVTRSIAAKAITIGAQEKYEHKSQNSGSMRECLRSLRHHQKVMISMENARVIYVAFLWSFTAHDSSTMS